MGIDDGINANTRRSRDSTDHFLKFLYYTSFLPPLCTSIGSIVFKCEGKDTNLFSNIQIFNVKNDQ